jgi:hypothetical protein
MKTPFGSGKMAIEIHYKEGELDEETRVFARLGVQT